MDDDMIKHYCNEDCVLLEVHQVDEHTHDITLVEYNIPSNSWTLKQWNYLIRYLKHITSITFGTIFLPVLIPAIYFKPSSVHGTIRPNDNITLTKPWTACYKYPYFKHSFETCAPHNWIWKFYPFMVHHHAAEMFSILLPLKVQVFQYNPCQVSILFYFIKRKTYRIYNMNLKRIVCIREKKVFNFM